MENIDTMKNMATGLKGRLEALRENEKVFLRAAGINEEIETARQDKEELEDSLKDAKITRDELKRKKADAVATTTQQIAETMNTVLPSGKAVFSYSEEGDKKRLVIGWKTDGVVTPYNGLSGGEKQIFDAALARVLNASVIVVEAAELDNNNLPAALRELGTLDAQVLVSTCHPIEDIPETFTKIAIGE